MGIKSERMAQTLRVMREVKDKLYQECMENDNGISEERFNSIVDSKITEVANVLDITKGSVADKCTRQIQLNTAEFKKGLLDLLTEEDGIFLEDRILKNATTKDNSTAVRVALDSIKNN